MSLQRPASPSAPGRAWPVLSASALRVGGVFLIALGLLAGCGRQEYEERLENTRKLFAHLEILDANLHRDWVDVPTGVKLRVPLQFSAMAAPASSAAASGSSLGGESGAGKNGDGKKGAAAPEMPDERQPKYLNVELPGLRGAFTTSLKVIGANGANSQADGFIYVLSNHHLANSGDSARTFHQDVVAAVAEALRMGVKPEDWRDERFPQKVGTFAEEVPYKSVVLAPAEAIFGVERRFSLYLYSQGDVQVVVLFVLPKDVDGSERLTDRIPLCLETLRVTGEKLAVPAAGGAPAKGSAAGF